MDKILQMLHLQQELNDATNGKNWENGITKNGKIIDWKRCAYLECAELIESYPWKHWKNIDATPDYENIKIETVDIWHFIMSQGLKEYKINNLGTIDDLAEQINNLDSFSKFSINTSSTNLDYYAQIQTVEDLIKKLFCEDTIEQIINSFIDIAIIAGLNLDTLYKLYVGKNILNQFRQDNGYKEGTYIKIWNGKEDNVTMQTILEKEPSMAPKALYEALKKSYPKT